MIILKNRNYHFHNYFPNMFIRFFINCLILNKLHFTNNWFTDCNKKR